MRLRSLILIASFFIASIPAMAQSDDYLQIFTTNYNSSLSIEIDPMAFILKGHSIHLRYSPMASDHFLVGIGAYALNLPDAIVDLNSHNRDRGWSVRIRSAYALYAEYFPKTTNDGWFIGEQVGIQSFKLNNNREGTASTSFNTVLAMTYTGYSWRPRGGSWYLKPWVGVGLTDRIDGINRIGSSRYQVGPIVPFFTLHVGYTL
jgi:hypothetical protein